MKINPSVKDYIKEETVFGIDKPDVFIKFKSQIEESKINVLKNIRNIKTASDKIAAYAAPAKASTKLNYYGISSDIIEFIVEDNPLKHNKIIPGVNIPIYDVDYLIEKDIKVVIVLAWNFFDYIVDKNKSPSDFKRLMHVRTNNSGSGTCSKTSKQVTISNFSSELFSKSSAVDSI